MWRLALGLTCAAAASWPAAAGSVAIAAVAPDESGCSCGACEVRQARTHRYVFGQNAQVGPRLQKPDAPYTCLAEGAVSINGTWTGRCGNFCATKCVAAPSSRPAAAPKDAVQSTAATTSTRTTPATPACVPAAAAQEGSSPGFLQVSSTRDLAADYPCPVPQPCTCWCHCKEVNYGVKKPPGEPPTPEKNPFMPPPPAPKPAPKPFFAGPPPATGVPFSPSMTVFAQGAGSRGRLQRARRRSHRLRRLWPRAATGFDPATSGGAALVQEKASRALLTTRSRSAQPVMCLGDGAHCDNLQGGLQPCSGPGCNARTKEGDYCPPAAPCNCYCACRPGVPSKDEAFR